MIGYKKEGINLITRYSVEYVNNKKDWEYICSGKISDGEPWEHYKIKQFDNIDSAMSFYIIYLVRDDIYDVKLFEKILLNGEIIREVYIQPDSTMIFSLKTAVNKALYETNNRLKEYNELLQEENSLFKEYLKMFNMNIDDFKNQLEKQKEV